jgi:hypothetical protein
MGLIFSADILTPASTMARSVNASYPANNVNSLWHLKRRFRATDALTDDWLLKFDMGEAKDVAGILLANVNFDAVQVQANGSDSWSSPAYDSGERTVSQNPFTGRYQVYIPVSFTQQWIRLYIPASASAVGDYTSAWEVGSIAILGSIHELAKGARELTRGASDQVETVRFPSGAHEAAQVGDALRWEGEFAWTPRRVKDEPDLLQLNRKLRAQPVVYYRNGSDTWDAYICRRDNTYSAMERGIHIEAQAMRFVEIL